MCDVRFPGTAESDPKVLVRGKERRVLRDLLIGWGLAR